MTVGVGGSRVVLSPPSSLGLATGHQVLKVGTFEGTQLEQKYFELLSRDFSYVPRPSTSGYIQVELAGWGGVQRLWGLLGKNLAFGP